MALAGTRTWGNEKYLKTLMGAVNTETDIPVVTTSDEAVALLLFENYREMWIHQFNTKVRGEKPGKLDGKYTTSTIGHGEYAGWSKEGLVKYSYYCNLVEMDRLCDTANNVEKIRWPSTRVWWKGKGGTRVTMTDGDSRKETRWNRWKPGVNGSASATMTIRKN